MIGLILVSLIVIVVSAWYVNYYKYYKHMKCFRGPRPLPIVGNALEYGSTAEILPMFLRHQKEYGGIVTNFLGFKPPFLLITDVKFMEFLLSSTKIIDKSKDYEFLLRWLGTGLLTGGGAKWKRHRKIITPAFHFQILEQFIDTFDFYSNILINKLSNEVDKDCTDIYPYVTLCSLDIICATSMGTTVNAQNNSESEYVSSVKEMCRIIIERSTSLLKMHDIFFYYFSKDYRKEMKALKILHGYTYSVINARKEKLENSEAEEMGATDDVGIKKKKTLLDLLLQYKKDGQPITDEEIREEVDTFMFEGHDTTASAISFTLFCLATNPDVQEKVVQELTKIFGNDKTRPALHRDLQEMKYLEMVIKETLRLYPSVPFYARNVDEDIAYDGAIIPKGTSLAIFAYGIHRRSEIYPDPERFDPERFTLENQSTRSPYAYIPFSAGPRNCIGQKFAMFEMKSVVSKVLRNYELLPTIPEHKLILIPETVLKSKNGICMRLKNRSCR